MKIPYTKPYLSLDAQLQLLQDRGVIITDKTKALSHLKRIGYYRLSAYLYPFRESVPTSTSPMVNILDTFHQGTLFSNSIDLYVFDKKLRLLLLDALERIEINIRVSIAYHLGSKDIYAHLKPNLLHGDFTKKVSPNSTLTKYKKWLDRLDKSITESNEEFVSHFRNKYVSTLPIWMAIELWDFGLLSTFFSGMKVIDKEAIAKQYNIPRWELLTSWLHSMNYVRNVCAHHSRIWNRSLTRQPKFPKNNEIQLLEHINLDINSKSKIYGVIAIMQYLLTTINPTSSWHKRLKEHCKNFPEVNGTINLTNAGFPNEWEKLPLWH